MGRGCGERVEEGEGMWREGWGDVTMGKNQELGPKGWNGRAVSRDREGPEGVPHKRKRE